MVLPQIQAGLFLDAFERAYGNVALWMWNGDAPLLRGVLELGVAAFAGNLEPSIRQQCANHIATLHKINIHTNVYLSNVENYPLKIA
jgi:hypothetical protein